MTVANHVQSVKDDQGIRVTKDSKASDSVKEQVRELQKTPSAFVLTSIRLEMEDEYDDHK